MTDEAVVDLREDQPWLLLPKAALDALAQETLSFPQDLPLKEASEESLRLTESFLAKLLLRQGRGLGILYGYRRSVERQACERAFREGIDFSLNVLRRLANSPEDTEESRLEDGRRDRFLAVLRRGEGVDRAWRLAYGSPECTAHNDDQP